MVTRHIRFATSEVELIRGEVVQETVVDRVLKPVEFLRTCAVVGVWIRKAVNIMCDQRGRTT